MALNNALENLKQLIENRISQYDDGNDIPFHLVNNYAEVLSASNLTLGRFGSDRFTDTASHTAPTDYIYFAIQAESDSVITSLTGNMTNATGISLLAGNVLYGRFTAIQLFSGSVICYKEPI